jgi:hypothetical protein
VSTQFGRTPDVPDEMDIAETVSMDPSQMSSIYTRHGGRSDRFQLEDSNQYSFSSAEDKVIILVGFLLFLVLALLVVWWVLV